MKQRSQSLLSAYEEVSLYNDTCVNADILFSYFEYKLKEHNIDVKPVPMEYEGEIVYYDYPPDLHYLSYDLERILKKNDTEIEPDESKSAIIALYAHYCKNIILLNTLNILMIIRFGKYYQSLKFVKHGIKNLIRQKKQRSSS